MRLTTVSPNFCIEVLGASAQSQYSAVLDAPASLPRGALPLPQTEVLRMTVPLRSNFLPWRLQWLPFPTCSLRRVRWREGFYWLKICSPMFAARGMTFSAKSRLRKCSSIARDCCRSCSLHAAISKQMKPSKMVQAATLRRLQIIACRVMRHLYQQRRGDLRRTAPRNVSAAPSSLPSPR